MENSVYSHFWALYNKLPGRYDGLKEELIRQFTGNRTESLRSMQPDEYGRLLAHLGELRTQEPAGSKRVWSNINIDRCRKRVIAAICGYYQVSGQEYSMRMVLATACRASRCGDFNLIPAQELHRVYNTFTAKQRDCNRAVRNSVQKLSQIALN